MKPLHSRVTKLFRRLRKIYPGEILVRETDEVTVLLDDSLLTFALDSQCRSKAVNLSIIFREEGAGLTLFFKRPKDITSSSLSSVLEIKELLRKIPGVYLHSKLETVSPQELPPS